MEWKDISITVPKAQADTAEAIATGIAGGGIYIEDYSDLEQQVEAIAHVDLIEQELRDKDKNTVIVHLYLSPDENPAEVLELLRQRLLASELDASLAVTGIEEEDWENGWKAFYHAMELGDRLAVCPSWESYERAPDEVVLTLDPGMAFGTGSHDTTRLCLELLEEHCAPGRTVLDVGSGSGILAIASVLLGCDHADGVEIDPTAVRVAQENSAINHTGDRVTFHCGDLVEKVSGSYDIVCANIVADIIIRLLPDAGRFMKPEAVLICSGIIDEREADVLAAVEKNGFAVRDRRESGGWVALACVKKEA